MRNCLFYVLIFYEDVKCQEAVWNKELRSWNVLVSSRNYDDVNIDDDDESVTQ
jgi:hypothetical protein